MVDPNMRNNHLKYLLLSLSFPLVLAGCDSKSPLSGKREAIFTMEPTIKPHPELSGTKIHLSAPETNADWPVQGGTHSHAIAPLALGQKLSQVWKTNLGYGTNDERKITSNIIVADHKVFGMDSHGHVVAIDLKSGNKLWTAETSPSGESGETLGGGVVYDNGVIYAATSFGDVIAFDVKDGKKLWSSHVTTPIRIAPTVKDGRIFAVSISNELFALNAKDGEVLWTHAGLPETTGLLGGGTPAIEGNTIVVTYSSGEIYGLRVENGYQLWNDALSSSMSIDSISSITHIRARPVIYQGIVYVVSHGGKIAAIDLNTGIRLWNRDLSGIRTPAVHNDYIFLITNVNELICMNRHTGEAYWSAALPTSHGKQKIFWAGPVIAGGSLVINGSNGEVLFYNPENGQKLHHLTTKERFMLSPVVAQQTLLALSEDGDVVAWR
jgi:outer membrane protein assembly factor BamB